MGNDKIILSSILEQRKKETAPELSEAKFFELFCASEILKDYDLSYEEINSGNIGAGNDGGIDSLYLLLNDELVQEDTDVEALSKKRKNEIEIYIIQSKRTDGFGEEAINKFSSSVEELFDLTRSLASLSKTYNNDLLIIIKKFREIQKCIITSFPKIYFRFYYATLGNEVHPNVKRKVDKLKQRVNDHFDSAEFIFEFLGARELLQLARREPVSTFEIEYSENPISTDTGSYVCLVPLKSYYSFFVDNEGMIIKRIFDANVRDYQGSVKVNKAIQDTLEKPGKEDFWFLNNGVTIICPKASASGKKLIIEDPQIVNGLQTSYEIYKYFAGLKFETGDLRKILVRVIVEQDPAARDNIVRATNSQTSIPQTSLRAADKIQRDIEDYFCHHDLFYERRKNYYKNAGKPISKIVSISYLSQAVISILLQQPDNARARPSTLIDKEDDYLRIFNENYPVPIYVICVRILKKVEDVIRANTEKYHLIRKDINNIKFHLAMRTAMELIAKSKNIRVEDIQTIKLEEVTDELISEQMDIVMQMYRNLGGDDQVAKGPDFVKGLINEFKLGPLSLH